MNSIKFDRKALTQVYEILLRLENDKFNKIPKEIIKGIESNRDIEYETEFRQIEENMLPDTEKILTSIYTYYLTNKEEKHTILKMTELEKKKKYGDKRMFS